MTLDDWTIFQQESDFSGCKTRGIIQERTAFLGPCPPDCLRQPNESHNQRLSWHNQVLCL